MCLFRNWDEFTDSSSFLGTPKPANGNPRRNGARPDRTDRAVGENNAAGAGKARRTVVSQPAPPMQPVPGPTASAGTGGAAAGSVREVRLAPTVVASTATLPRSTVIGHQHTKVPTGRQPRHTIAGV